MLSKRIALALTLDATLKTSVFVDADTITLPDKELVRAVRAMVDAEITNGEPPIKLDVVTVDAVRAPATRTAPVT